MADYWGDNLLPAMLDGVEFPVKERRIRGGFDFARARYQGTPGQDIEQTGLKARSFSITIELFREVDESHYPELYVSLHDLLTDIGKGGALEYTDIVWGPIPVQLADWDVIEESGMRNGATISLELEERSTDPVTFVDGAYTDPRAQSVVHAENLDAALADMVTAEEVDESMEDAGFPLTEEELETFPELFLTLTDGFFAALDEGALAADELAWEVDRYRARIDRILAFDPMQDAENWSAYYSAIALADTITKAADLFDSDSAEDLLVDYTVPRVMSSAEISVELYGDATKAGDIEARNPTPNPLFYPEGKVLTVEGVF